MFKASEARQKTKPTQASQIAAAEIAAQRLSRSSKKVEGTSTSTPNQEICLAVPVAALETSASTSQ